MTVTKQEAFEEMAKFAAELDAYVEENQKPEENWHVSHKKENPLVIELMLIDGVEIPYRLTVDPAEVDKPEALMLRVRYESDQIINKTNTEKLSDDDAETFEKFMKHRK